MYSNSSSSPDVDDDASVARFLTHAPSCLKRPSAVRFTGVECGMNGLISVTQPKRFGSFGSTSALKRLSVVCHR